MWKCSISCRSIRPACGLYAGRLEANAAVPVVAKRESVLVPNDYSMVSR